MLLKVPERLMVLGLLSQMEGDFILLRMVRSLQTETSFSSDEVKLLDLQQRDNQWAWKGDADQGKEIEIPEQVQVALIIRMEVLSSQEKLNLAQLGLYERFTEGGLVTPLRKERSNGEGRGQRVPNRAERRARIP